MNRITIAALGLLSAGFAIGQDVVNEGTGSRRDALDRMIHQPAPIATVLGGESWIGSAPALGDLSGRPVLVFTWAEWYRPSHAVAMLAKRLQDEFEDLVVIGVHDAEGWDEAKTFAERRRLSFPIVHDEDGSIRDELRVDQDPDVYVIDRAGQVRYADITTDSVRTAVAEVAGEDTDSASTIESRLEQQRAEAELASRQSRAINDGIAFGQKLNVPFMKPSPDEYTSAAWPAWPRDENSRSRRDTPGLVNVALPAVEFFRQNAPVADGRVVVMYIWHPSERETIDELMYQMDQVQRTYSRDVVVIGAMIPPGDDRRRRNEPVDPIRALPMTNDTIEQYVGSRNLDHYLVALPGSPLPSNSGRSRDGATFYGTIGIISTDGVLRRQELSSEWEALRRALDTTLRVDPGVKARRAAEDAFIRAGG